MILLYFFLPIIFTLLTEIPDFRKIGLKKAVIEVGFWLRLLFSVLFTLGMLILLFMDFGAFLEFSTIKLFVAFLSSISVSILIFWYRYLRKKTSFLKKLVFCLLIALFLEGTLFQFRFYQTFDYQEIDYSDRYLINEGFEPTNNRPNEYFLKSTFSMIELKNINQKVHNVYFDVIARNQKDRVVGYYVTTFITDESNENYLKLPEQSMISTVESTKFLSLLTNGKSENLKFQISSDNAEIYEIRSIRLNVSQPFQFNVWRFLVLSSLLFLFFLLSPSSKVFSYRFTDSIWQRGITGIVIFAEIAILLLLTVLNPAFLQNPARHTAQYQELAESFMDGELALKEEPPSYLAEMDNPYDLNERREQVNIHGEGYYWDAAYYDGNYYVYFGVLPVILLYLPFLFFTGYPLPNFVAVEIFLCFFVVGSFLLMSQILKKYFRTHRISFISYLLLSLIFVNASGAVFIAKRPDFYSVPIIAGLAFTVFGLYFWLKSKNNSTVQPIFAGAGSLCMALVAACRPQLLLVSLMAVVIFWTSVFSERSLFSKKSWKSTVAICLPYILVAASLMWYNYARFGSPFDFGANYNLTTNDMTGRGFRVERLGLSLFTYFFQFPNITASFPFLQSSPIQTNYLGTTITEPMFGGIFMVIPLLWALVMLPFYRKHLQKKGILSLCLLPLCLSIVLALFDAQGAGLLQRYVSDFAFLACFAAIVVFFFFEETSLGERKIRTHAFLRFAFFATVIYCFLCVFAVYSVELFYQNPTLFHYVKKTVQFW